VAILFAKRVFQVAAIWGLFVLPLAYLGYLLGVDGATVTTNRPEIVHGFFLVTLAWQFAFWIISTDPARFRLLMPVAMLEKFPFMLAVIALFANGQAAATTLVLGLIDGVFGALFVAAYIGTKPAG
jgi:hypothetical protein